MRLLIIGATGLVGENLLKLLENSNLFIEDICFVSSSNKEINFKNKKYITSTLDEINYSKYNIACITSNSIISKKVTPILIENNYVIIDNSSAYRDVYPLCIPEINFNKNDKIFINPNCSVIQCVLPLYYINNQVKINKIIYNTYQSLSGAGRLKLSSNIKTCIPKIGDITNDSSEEIKMIKETKKLLNEDIEVIANCVRVPVKIGHLVNIIIEVESTTYDELLSILENKFKYLKDVIIPDITNDSSIYIMRLKQINDNTFSFYTYANNLLRGSSYNTFLTLSKISL